MRILAYIISYAWAFMAGAVVTEAIFRAKRRKARARRTTFIKSRDRALNLSREMEQSVVKLSRTMKRSGITGVTVYKGITENCDDIIAGMRGVSDGG